MNVVPPLLMPPLARTDAPTDAAMPPPRTWDPVEKKLECREALLSDTEFADILMLPENTESPAEQTLGPMLLKLKHDGPIMRLIAPPDTSTPLEDMLEFIIAIQFERMLSTADT